MSPASRCRRRNSGRSSRRMAEHDLPVWVHPMRGPHFSDYASEKIVGERDLVQLRLALRDHRLHDAADLFRAVRRAADAQDHHPSHGRHDPVLRRQDRARLPPDLLRHAGAQSGRRGAPASSSRRSTITRCSMPIPRSTARSRRPAAATLSSAPTHCLFATDAPFDAEQGRGLIAQHDRGGEGAGDFRRRSGSGFSPAMRASCCGCDAMSCGDSCSRRATRTGRTHDANREHPSSSCATARWAPISPIPTRRRPARSSPSWKSGASTTPCGITRMNSPKPASSAWCPTCSGGRSRASSSPTAIPSDVKKAFDLYYDFDYDLGVRDMEDTWHYLADAAGVQRQGRRGRLLPRRQALLPDVLPHRHRLRGRLLRHLYRAQHPRSRRTCTGRSCCTWR